MPLGENVGTAYVRLFVDGSGLDKQIRDEFDKAEPAYRKAGAAGAQSYDEEFADYIEKKGVSKDALRESLTEGLKESDFTRDFFNSPEWESQKKRISKEFEGLGSTMSKDIQDQFTKRGTLDGLAEVLGNLDPVADKARKSLVGLANAEASITSKDQDKRWELHIQRLREISQVGDELRKNTEEAERKAAHDQDKRWDLQIKNMRFIENFGEQLRRNMAETDRQTSQDQDKRWDLYIANLRRASEENAAFEADFRQTMADMDKSFEGLNKEFDKHSRIVRSTEKAYLDAEKGFDTLYRDMEKNGTQVSKFTKKMDDARKKSTGFFNSIENGMGAAFGRGSRNDFINIIGSTVRGLTRLVTLLPKAGIAIGTHLAKSFEQAGGGAQGVISVLGQMALGLGGVVAAIAAAGPLLAAAFAGLSLILGPIAALMSGLLGIVAALAATIGFALVAAVGVLAGALVPLGAGLAVAIGGFLALSDAQKTALKADARPLIDAFKGLGQTAATALTKNVGENAKRLAPVLESLTPLVDNIATAISNVGDSWTESVTGKGFRLFRKRIENEIPTMVEHLGNIFGNTLGGFGGIFTGAIPTIQRFLGWLDKLTDRFNTWANSAKGQEKIKKFFDRASDSAETLWKFLKRVWNVTKDILDQGKGTGDTLFDKLGDNVEKFGKYLDENPDALTDWFANAKETATNLGKIAENMGKIFAALDSEKNRKNMQAFLGFLDTLSSGDVSTSQSKWENLGGTIGKVWDFFQSDKAQVNSRHFLGIDEGVNWAEQQLQSFYGWIDGWFQQFGAAVRAWGSRVGESFMTDFVGVLKTGGSRVASAVSEWGQGVGDSFVNDFITPIQNFFSGLASRISGWVGQIDWSNLMSNPAPVIQRLFLRMSGRIQEWIGSIKWSSIIPSPSPRVRAFFAGMSSSIARWIGNLNWSSVIPSPNARVKGFFTGMAADIAGWIGKLDWSSIIEDPTGTITGWFNDLASSILDAIGHIDLSSLMHGSFKVAGKTISWATGGIADHPMHRIIGEAGPEAVVPLRRPLSQVDPAVRELSAFAQGKTTPASAATAAAAGNSGTYIAQGAITVITPASDARAVAWETLNYISAAGY